MTRLNQLFLCFCICTFGRLFGPLATLGDDKAIPKIEWIAETTATDQNSFGGFSLDGDQIFVGDEDGDVRALSKKTGEILWTVERQGRAFSAPPCDSSRVYFASHHGLTAVSRASGEFDWRFSIAEGAENSILAQPQRVVIVGGLNGKIYAIAAETGDEIWRLDIMEDAPPAPPGFDASKLRGERDSAMPMRMQCDNTCAYVCIADQCRIVAIELASGKKKWSYQTADAVYCGPTVSDDYLIVGSRDQHFHCLHKETGTLKWKFKTEGSAAQKGVIEKDLFYVGAGDGRFYCLSLADGTERWRFETDKDEKGKPNGIYTAPIMKNDHVLFAAQDAKLYSLEKATGKLRWKFSVDAHSAVWKDIAFDGERVYLVLRKRHSRENGFDPKGLNAIVAVTPAE